MDVEKTIEFILEQQARLVVQQQKTDEGLRALTEEVRGVAEEVRKLAEQQRKTDRKLNILAQMVRVGLKEMVRTDQKIKALIDAQMRAEARMDRSEARLERLDVKFERLMAALLRKGPNGRGR